MAASADLASSGSRFASRLRSLLTAAPTFSGSPRPAITSASSAGAIRRRPVTAGVFGADVAAAITVTVAQVPALAGSDPLAETGADRLAGSDEGGEPLPQQLVVVAVSRAPGPVGASDGVGPGP